MYFVGLDSDNIHTYLIFFCFCFFLGGGEWEGGKMVKTKLYEANYELNLLKGEGLRQDGLKGKKMSQGRYDV